MEHKKPFKKLTIPDKKVEPTIKPQMIDELMAQIDREVDLAMVDLLRQLGYDAKEGMTHEEAKELQKKMREADEFVSIDTRQEGNSYIVEMRVVQLAKTLKFDLGGEQEK